MPRVFLRLLVTASTQAWWPPSALYPIVNVPDHGEMASAWAQSFLAWSALNVSTSEPLMVSDHPAMTGDVKSLAGVRVPWKIVSVTSLRLIDIEIAWRRRLPSAPVKCARFCGIVNDWKIAAGWLIARSPRSFL